MTFDDLLAAYVKYRILRPETVASYRDALRNLDRYFLSHGEQNSPRIDALTVEQLLAHRQWCLAHIRATSYNKHRRHLRALLNFAVEHQYLQASPLTRVSGAPAGTRRPKIVPTSWYRRTTALLQGQSVPGLNPTNFWKTVFDMLHFTGMRCRQLIELRWRDVDWARSAVLLASEGSKTRREWVVPVPRWVVQELKDLKTRAQAVSGRHVAPEDQVFCLPLFAAKMKSEKMNNGHISRAFEALSRHLGYTISAHRVRHTSATIMMMATGHLKGVSDMLGHSDIKLTASTYVHPSLSHLRKVQSTLSGYKTD